MAKKLLKKASLNKLIKLPEPEFKMVPIDALKNPTFYMKKDSNIIDSNLLRKSVYIYDYGILTVAHFSLDKKEVIDGLKRLEILRRSEVKEVRCLDYGDIPRWQRLLLSRVLNNNWTEIDTEVFNKYLKLEIKNKINVEQLKELMPEAVNILNELSELLKFDKAQIHFNNISEKKEKKILQVKKGFDW
jgi:hypothetical protein